MIQEVGAFSSKWKRKQKEDSSAAPSLRVIFQTDLGLAGENSSRER
jgi:hypothetical protein